jgi:type IV secretory pathway VirB2 component (pilin)
MRWVVYGNAAFFAAVIIIILLTSCTAPQQTDWTNMAVLNLGYPSSEDIGTMAHK